MEIVGYDPRRRRHIARSFDDQGASDEFAVALRGRAWTIDGEAMRFRGQFDRSGDTLAGTWERRSRSRWQPWMTIELVRAA